MGERQGIFAGDDPFALARAWLAEAAASEPRDANAMALATADAAGLPDVRMVLLKEIEDDGFVFYTNYESAKGQELAENPQAALVLHWKSLGRQVRARGAVERVEGEQADAYYRSRALQSRLGAWASQQSRPLASRAALMAEVAKVGLRHGTDPERPPYWGGFRIRPSQMEFWADGAYRLHDRFRWTRQTGTLAWKVDRLNP
ncbi:pyridoxamine 5'-phosphate oxidase [Pseudoroseicyclus sp. CXY001]|uniref:pyridoxamine 5'-phosphate oxidase n=1 Tax=Pseudoroseicyclus sp. CXY001 TaxID=3242492 RepID=UPI00358DD309